LTIANPQLWVNLEHALKKIEELEECADVEDYNLKVEKDFCLLELTSRQTLKYLPSMANVSLLKKSLSYRKQ
jgi:hypothetical protein